MILKQQKLLAQKKFFPKNEYETKYYNTREEGPFNIRFNILAEDFQFKEKKIYQVKPPKNNIEKKKLFHKFQKMLIMRIIRVKKKRFWS